MSPGDSSRDQTLAVFREEVLRWNRRFSLISRQDSSATLDSLMNQSREAIAALVDGYSGVFTPDARIRYFDLGSGGGIPGFLWHLSLHDHCKEVGTWLVEPRDKRAWFLERLATQTGQVDLNVVPHRWEDAVTSTPELTGDYDAILVSMKALHLSDREVLTGLERVLEHGSGPLPGRLLVTRFYPPDTVWTPGLARELEVPDPGTERSLAGRRWVAGEGSVLKSTGGLASLVVSDYCLVPAG